MGKERNCFSRVVNIQGYFWDIKYIPTEFIPNSLSLGYQAPSYLRIDF